MCLDRCERFSATNCVEDRGDTKTARKRKESKLISRRHVTAATNQGHEPAIAFDLEKDRAAFFIRWRGLYVSALPVNVEVLGNAVQPARIREMCIDYDLLDRLVPHVFE